MTRLGMRSRIAAAVVASALLVAACGDDGNDAAAGDTSGATAVTGDDPTATAEDTMGGGGGYYGGGEDDDAEDESGAGEDDPTVQANNFAFDPSEIEIASGEDLSVRNGNANTPHTFTVDGSDIDVELAPLATDEVTVDLDPGSYDFRCRFHPDMQGTLTVT